MKQRKMERVPGEAYMSVRGGGVAAKQVGPHVFVITSVMRYCVCPTLRSVSITGRQSR